MSEPRPGSICVPCFEQQRDVWVSRVWLYCEHHRVMARRRRETDPWTLDRAVSPKKAQVHIAAALVKMRAHCAKQGLTLGDASLMCQRLFEKERGAGQ